MAGFGGTFKAARGARPPNLGTCQCSGFKAISQFCFRKFAFRRLLYGFILYRKAHKARVFSSPRLLQEGCTVLPKNLSLQL